MAAGGKVVHRKRGNHHVPLQMLDIQATVAEGCTISSLILTFGCADFVVASGVDISADCRAERDHTDLTGSHSWLHSTGRGWRMGVT